MTLGERICAAREGARLSKAELARRVGVSRATVGQWESGEIKRLEAENLLRLADVLRVDPTWLLTGRGEMATGVRESRPTYPTRFAPRLSWDQVPVWERLVADFEHGGPLPDIPVDPSFPPRCFALIVEGSSMAAEFPSGSIIIVDPDTQAEPGRYVVAVTDDGQALLRLVERDGTILQLRALAPGLDIIPVSRSTICGVVIFRSADKHYGQ